MTSSNSLRLPERDAAPCPTCNLPGGFHDAQTHAKVEVDPKFFKEKDWQKSNTSLEEK